MTEDVQATVQRLTEELEELYELSQPDPDLTYDVDRGWD